MSQTITMDKATCGERFIVVRTDDTGALQKRLGDLGITRGAEVDCLFTSPLGDPVAYRVCNTVLALRKADTRRIEVTLLE